MTESGEMKKRVASTDEETSLMTSEEIVCDHRTTFVGAFN